MKQILITGGAGFIGTNLVSKILTDYPDVRVTVLDTRSINKSIFNQPKNLTIIKGNITNTGNYKKSLQNIDTLIHLAAKTWVAKSVQDPFSFINANLYGTVNLLELAVKNRVKHFIYVSSSEVYGNRLRKMDEAHPLNPVTPYAVSKLAAEKMVMSYYYCHKLPVTVVRTFNNYGPWQTPEKMIPLFITRLICNQPIVINHSGKPRRDWLFVGDHTDALLKIMKASKDKVVGQIFNIGTNKDISIAEIAYCILKYLGKSRKLVSFSKNSPIETMANVGISDKIYKSLRWKAKTDIREGIKITVDWYKNHASWWKKFT